MALNDEWPFRREDVEDKDFTERRKTKENTWSQKVLPSMLCLMRKRKENEYTHCSLYIELFCPNAVLKFIQIEMFLKLYFMTKSFIFIIVKILFIHTLELFFL